MELILWRHAEAEEGVPGVSDMSRQLTKRGLSQARTMAGWLKTKLPENTLVLTSPAQRARQTAMALCHDFDIVQEIGPGASVNQILAAADWPYAQCAVVVVGHQPTLSETVCVLLSTMPSGLFFNQGAIWWITCQKQESAFVAELCTVKYPEML
ncbi:phosphohistidine phosphatase, SixA [Nitrosomonas aestuarii]|uniref:Phosphohistidine phosphatase, SixA n=1 Tax=Nitrosomonas aestuarii TaxID=52441 RepID=A0A1I4E5I3_9PROT|nr:phosphohistidine phosphatase SixA [Nitrosomonas aestuarii]SFL01032.1 phosphohistidine phosphatase, SixA [Nitrosomonas aestuarii]